MPRTIKEVLSSIYTDDCPRSVLELLKECIDQMDKYEEPSYVCDIQITRIS